MIIDVHGHYTTAPAALGAWRDLQIAGLKDPSQTPRASDLKISDDEIRETIENNQLKLMKQRGSDLTIFSPRASFMAHHIGNFETSSTWAAICNELCYRVSELFPDHFIPAAMLPQSPGVDPKTCIPELVKCVEEYGNVGINLNPDPSGGHWTAPPLSDRSWYPHLRKNGGVRHPCHDPRLDQLQCLLSHHRRPLSERRHHGLHAMPDQRSVQGLSHAQVPYPSWWRRCALSLGPFPWSGTGAEKAPAGRAPAQQHLL
jgi:hypothetical protein